MTAKLKPSLGDCGSLFRITLSPNFPLLPFSFRANFGLGLLSVVTPMFRIHF